MPEKSPRASLRKTKNGLCLAVSTLVIIVFAVYFFFNIFRFSAGVPTKATAVSYALTALLVSAFLVGLYFFISRKNPPVERLFVLFMLVTGVMYTAGFLPFLIPDEAAHYLSSYRISNYLTFNFKQAGSEELLIRAADAELYGLRAEKLTPSYYHTLLHNFEFFAGGEMTAIPAKFISSAPLGYVFSAVGIALGRLLHLGSLPTFYLGRLANLAVYTLAVWWCMKRIPYGKTALFAISAMPMTVHLVATYSYDFAVIAAAMLFVTQVLYMREKSGIITAWDIILCLIWGVILAPMKLVYFPIFFTVFLIPSEKFGRSKTAGFFIKCAVVASGILVLFIMQFGVIAYNIGSGNECQWTDGELYSLKRFLTNPKESLRILMNTFISCTDFNLASMVGSYLCKHQIVVPFFMWIPMLLMLIFSFIRRTDEKNGVLSFGNKLQTTFIGGGTALLIALSILFLWTPVTANHILGLQGRYFTPLLPLVFLILRGKALTRPENSDKYIVYFCFYYCHLMLLIYFGGIFA